MGDTFNYDNFNSFISQAAQTISCDSECQKQKTTQQLEQDYLNAQANLASASNQVQVTQQKYVTFAQGEQEYNNLNTQQLTQEALKISGDFQNNFEDEVEEIQTAIQSYSSLYINFQNVNDLYVTYRNENNELYKDLKDGTSDTLTNERKTYYQDQGIDNLKFWYYYVLLTIYIIIAAGFGVFSFIYPSQMNWKYRFAILIGLCILPFISTYLLDFLLKLLHYLYELMPKNVRLQ